MSEATDRPGRERDRKRRGWPADSMVVLTDATGARPGRLIASARAVVRARRRHIDIRLAIFGRDGAGFARALIAIVGGRAVQFVDREPELARLRAAADVFLQTVEHDNETTALEAMASGLPVLLPPSDGAAALVTDGVQGWILQNPISPREIAWRLRNLAEPGLRGAMAAQARALAEHCRERGPGGPRP